ncbi:uncharacterized protein LOC124285332 [Haliotis rubra]|uniref:uncharacterized protein LOC124285332 n=1 Tax=Haliotis rubra TaxID=36100 RepID=UPI001EE60660|nr:uncharacterized protein LOC124285332 [Haliotis rubra]
MLRILACLIVLASFGASQSATLHRNKRWNNGGDEYAVAPDYKPMALDDPRRQKQVETYSDTAQGLTVVKDPSDGIKACFITDLDPEFFLDTEEKLGIVSSPDHEPFIVSSPIKFEELQDRAGPIISKLCSRLHTFWLNAQLPPPLAKGQAPPSTIKSTPAIIRTPAPIHLANHNIVETVLAPGAQAHVMRTPPPLHRDFKTPPLCPKP